LFPFFCKVSEAVLFGNLNKLQPKTASEILVSVTDALEPDTVTGFKKYNIYKREIKKKRGSWDLNPQPFAI